MRFKVGDKVLANVGERVTGTIVRIGDNGHASRIELRTTIPPMSTVLWTEIHT